MRLPVDLHVELHGPLPIRRQLAEQLRHAIEGGRVARDQPLPSIRELAGLLGINPNTVARVIDDLKQGGYVEARRGRGIFVAAAPPARPSPGLREVFLRDAVVRAAALGMTAEDLAVGVLSLGGNRPAAVRGVLEVLLVEGSPSELDFCARELERHLPVRVDAMPLAGLARAVRRQPRPPWSAAVTSFRHLPAVERALRTHGLPVIALLAGAHLETLHRLGQLPPRTRVGVVAAEAETALGLRHSIEAAGLPNIALAGACPAAGPALGRMLRRVDAVVCSASVVERVRALAGGVAVIVDDRTLDPRVIERLAALLVRRQGGAPAGPPPPVPGASATSRRRRERGRRERDRAVVSAGGG